MLIHFRHILFKYILFLVFEQSQRLKSYINFNTEKRYRASNSFEKDLFKLMNNGVYTNTMKGSRKRVDARLAMNAKDYYKLAFKLILVAQKIINKNLTALLKFFLKLF